MKERAGSVSIQPIIVTPDLNRLLAFYSELLGAEEISRVAHDDGAPFYVGLRVGDSELGLVTDAGVELGAPQRVLLSVDVPDVDHVLARVPALGGHASGAPNDMPWGQRVAHITDPDGNPVNLTQRI